MDTAPLIHLVNVTKEYRMGNVTVPALRGVTFDTTEGEMVAIMGASGSGKSTLMHILGCLDKPTTGEYGLDGVPVNDLNDRDLAEIRNQKIGFVFQTFNLLPRASALRNVEVPLIYGDGRHRQARARHALETVGLAHRLRHRPTEMSGGEQQRVSIARALVTEPRILLADEPTGNLDSRTSSDIIRLLQQLNSQRGMTVVIVTHEPEIAAHCERIVSLFDGQITEDAPVTQRLWSPGPPTEEGQ